MRRRKHHNFLTIKVLAVIISFIAIVSIGYSYFSLRLDIKGYVSGIASGYTITPDSYPYLTIKVSKTNSWQESGLYYYQYELDVTNIGSSTLDNFKITLNFNPRIKNVTIWNYDYQLSNNNKSLVIINNTTPLASNQTTNIGFIISSTSSKLALQSVKLETVTTLTQVPLDQFVVNFQIASGWGAYTYQYNVSVINNTSSKITAWQLDITLPAGTTYVNGWDGIFSTTNNILTIKNTDYNGALDVNGSTSFSLQLSTDIINFIPTNIVASVR